MAKNLFDASIFAGALAGLDLFGNSIRKAMEHDYYDSRTTFKAIVLSDPQAMNAAAAAAIDPTDASAGSTSVSTAKWIFKGRILDHNSPHDFLPDPCNPDYASDKKLAAQIINMHTTFTTPPGMKKPSRYNIVLVELDKGPFSFNLQYGRCTDIIQTAKIQASAYAKSTTCKSVADNFDASEKTLATAQYGANFMMPTQVAYPILSLFSPPGTSRTVTVNGVTKTAPHRGWDIAAPGGTPLFAMCPGTAIAKPGCAPVGHSVGGRVVTINCKFPGYTGPKFKVVYKHMGPVALGGDSQFGVTKSGASHDTAATSNTKEVGSGDYIGEVGPGPLTCSQGPHLHFEIYKDNVAQDPADLLGYTYANSQTTAGTTPETAPYKAFADAFALGGSKYQALESSDAATASGVADAAPPPTTELDTIGSSTELVGGDGGTAPENWYGADNTVPGTHPMTEDILAKLEDKARDDSGSGITMDDYDAWLEEKNKADTDQARNVIVVEWEDDDENKGNLYLFDFVNKEYYTQDE